MKQNKKKVFLNRSNNEVEKYNPFDYHQIKSKHLVSGNKQRSGTMMKSRSDGDEKVYL